MNCHGLGAVRQQTRKLRSELSRVRLSAPSPQHFANGIGAGEHNVWRAGGAAHTAAATASAAQRGTLNAMPCPDSRDLPPPGSVLAEVNNKLTEAGPVAEGLDPGR